MIGFFRKIRKKFADDNKPLKYARYAIGEIVLVVIGILIALQINNWNEDNKLAIKELNLLEELRANLQTNVENLEKDIEKQTQSIFYFKYIMALADQKKPYNDSIPNALHIANYAPDVVLTASAFETFKSAGLDIIRTDSLRREILTLFEVTYPTLMQETKRLEDQLWPAVVIPLYQKHFTNENENWIPNDYEKWLKDKEFFNMLSFRRSLREQSTLLKIKTSKQTTEVIQLIEKELNSRKNK
jgi:hypothetical protein